MFNHEIGYQCPGCRKYYPETEFVRHHRSYEPEEIIIICRRCHIGIHKTGIPSGRKEFLKNKKANQEEEAENAIDLTFIDTTKEGRKWFKKNGRWIKKQSAKKIKSGRGWGVLH